jgi:serine/threonine-protein kinase
MEDLTGKQLGKYQVISPLGEGGMAAVFKAYQADMDRYVALKVLPRHYASDPEFMARFQQEARMIAKLQHPHILPVFDFGEAESYTFLVMPLVETGTLADQMGGQPVSRQRIRTVITQMGDALDYAHSRGVIHRDVKPSNILLDERGNCLLTDFGIAKMVEGTAHITQSGAIVGTPAYMSPEQGAGQALTPASDIYSLGVVMYEMATGRAPYVAETPMAVVIKHINEPLPPPTKLNPALPPATERVILKALNKDPKARFASAAHMVKEVRAAIPELPDVEPDTVRPGPGTTVVERPSQPAWQPSARVAQPAPGAPAQPGRAPKPAKAKGSRWGLWLGLGGIVAAAVCAVAVLGGGALVVTTSGTSTAEAMALASAQASGTAEAERLQATSAAATALADEATALAVIVQNATGTAQAAPTALPTIVSAAAWPVVLTDEFAANDNGWHPFDTFEDDYGTRRFLLSRGRYNWEVTPLKDIHLHDTPNIASLSDFLVSVDARQTSGPASADYGLAFRVVSDNTLYTFNISDTGQFAVQLLYQGQWTTLVNWTPTAAVRPGESNNLKVLAVGDQFTFFVNDQEVARLGDDSVPQGRVGVAVDHFEEGVTASWEFDNFELRAP